MFKFPPGFSGWCTSNYKSNKTLLQTVLIHGVYYINITKLEYRVILTNKFISHSCGDWAVREQGTSRLAVQWETKMCFCHEAYILRRRETLFLTWMKGKPPSKAWCIVISAHTEANHLQCPYDVHILAFHGHEFIMANDPPLYYNAWSWSLGLCKWPTGKVIFCISMNI